MQPGRYLRLLSCALLLCHALPVQASAVLVDRARVTALASGFHDYLFDNGTYYDLFFSLADAQAQPVCDGNHVSGLGGLWAFAPGSETNPLRSRQLFALLNAAWIADLRVTVTGQSPTSCTAGTIEALILHKPID